MTMGSTVTEATSKPAAGEPATTGRIGSVFVWRSLKIGRRTRVERGLDVDRRDGLAGEVDRLAGRRGG